jgi:hypothetical protein
LPFQPDGFSLGLSPAARASSVSNSLQHFTIRHLPSAIRHSQTSSNSSADGVSSAFAPSFQFDSRLGIGYNKGI